jgi:hypothetical protein
LTGPTGPTGTILYNFYQIGQGTGYTGPYGLGGGTGAGNNYFQQYVTGITGFSLAKYTIAGGPDGPPGPVANTVLILNIGFRWHIPGAMYCLPGYGPTGIFIDEGFPFKGSS